MENEKKYWNKSLQGMEGYVPGHQPVITASTIKLNTNENPYPPSPQVLQAINNATDSGLRFYPPSSWDDLRSTISDAYDISTENIFCGNGCDEILMLVLRSFANPGDSVLLTYPTYSLYEVLASSAGLKYTYHDTNEDFSIPFDTLPRKGFSIAFITNPNAPTGRIEDREALHKFINEFEGVIVVDETYIDFTENYGNATALTLIHDCPNLLVSRTLSKAFSLCGIRVGYGFGDASLIKGLMICKDSYNLDLLAQKGATAAISDMNWMKTNALKIIETRKTTAAALETLGFKVLPANGNFLFITHPTCKARMIYEELLKQEIYVRFFDYRRLDNYLRISIGTDEEMNKVLTAISTILNI